MSLELTQSEFRPWRPFFTLFKKEILRFYRVGVQTILTPTVTTSLYLFVFGINLGKRISIHPDFSYLEYVIPGLILLGVVNNSFANASSSLFVSRYMNNIVDLLVTPLTPTQFILGYSLAAMIRGLTVGTCIFVVSTFFSDLQWVNPGMAILYAVLTSLAFSQLGLIAAIYSNTFDVLSLFNHFLIMPLVFLGGVFYPISSLPGGWKTVSQLNPLYYLIDGFRDSALGIGEVQTSTSLGVAILLSATLFLWAATLIRTGYKMRT